MKKIRPSIETTKRRLKDVKSFKNGLFLAIDSLISLI